MAHNVYAQLAAEAGILALVALIWLLGSLAFRWLRGVWRTPRASSTYPVVVGLGTGLLSVALHNTVESGFTLMALGLLFSAQAGVLVGVTAPRTPVERRSHAQGNVAGMPKTFAVLGQWAARAGLLTLALIVGLQWGSWVALVRGHFQETDGAVGQAAASYSLASTINPVGGVQGRLSEANLYWKHYLQTHENGALPKAEEAARAAIANAPRHLEAHLILAQVLQEKEGLVGAATLTALQDAAALRRPYQEPALYLRLGQAYAAQGMLSEAQAAYGAVVEGLSRGVTGYGNGVTPADVRQFLSQAHLGLGGLTFCVGGTEEATAHLQMARELQPGDPTAVLALAVTLYHSGQYQEALDSAQGLLALRPDDSLGFYYRSLAHKALGHDAQGQRDLRLALAVDPAVPQRADQLATCGATG